MSSAPSSMRTLSFEEVANYVSQQKIAGNFPPDVLRNRLIGMGAKEVLEGGIKSLGFPLRYHHPVDEIILVLHYFLGKCRSNKGSFVRINSIHIPTKEEENTLSFWKSPKAGLYLDLHSLIENCNNQVGEPGHIKRIFVFRDNAHLAFLESTGIGVILEQQSINIKTEFLLMNRQGTHRRESIKGGTVLIQLIHKKSDLSEWALIIDKEEAGSQPYENRLICRWHKGRIFGMKDGKISRAARGEEQHLNLERYLELFEYERLPVDERTDKFTYFLPSDPEEFSELLTSNFKAAFGEIEPPAHYNDQLVIKSVPSSLKQFNEALVRTRQSETLRAIDASSVKSTLKIHEADPNYRHWIRATVNRAIQNPEVGLERIYILDLDKTKQDYAIFEQEINLYRDFMTGKVSRLDQIWTPSAANSVSKPAPNGEQTNIKLYAITKRAVKIFCETLPQHNRAELFGLLQGDFIKEDDSHKQTPERITDLISKTLPRLDFLFSEKLIFNYRDLKGEPGQAFYDADLFVPDEDVANKDGGAAVGDRSDSKQARITCMQQAQFMSKQEKYCQIYDLMKALSIQVLTDVDGELLRASELENKLKDKRLDYMRHLTQHKTLTSPDERVRRTIESTHPQLFLSHAKEDTEKVKEVYYKLESLGYKPWMDTEDVLPGEAWEHAIEVALTQSTIRLAFLSDISVRKRGYIQKEFNTSIEIGKTMLAEDIHLIPVKLEECAIPKKIEKYQWVDLFGPKGWERLEKAIKEGIERRKQ